MITEVAKVDFDFSGKTVEDYILKDSELIIKFTDNTFAVYKAIANDGWQGDASILESEHSIEKLNNYFSPTTAK